MQGTVHQLDLCMRQGYVSSGDPGNAAMPLTCFLHKLTDIGDLCYAQSDLVGFGSLQYALNPSRTRNRIDELMRHINR